MKLHMHPVSQHSRRVLMLCHELGQDIETIPVALDKGEQKSPEYIRLSLTGRVPALQDGDLALAESHAIMKYLVAKTGGQPFYPDEPASRAKVDMWLDWNHTVLNPPIQTIAIETFAHGSDADQNVVGSAREQAAAALQILEAAFDANAAMGLSPTLADFSLSSTLALLEMVGGDLSPYRNVSAWYERLKQRPSFSATAPQMD